MLSAIATEFGTDIKAVSVAIFLTLAARPFGALFFGLLADKFGRRPILMIDVTLFSIFSFALAFAPSLVALLILRKIGRASYRERVCQYVSTSGGAVSVTKKYHSDGK